MKYLGIRVDTPDASYDAPVLDTLLGLLAPFGKVTHCVYAHEISVKTKKDHFHAHLILDETIDSTKKWLKGISSYLCRKINDNDPDHTTWLGLQLANRTLKYTFAEKKLCDSDVPRWQRYPLKDIEEWSCNTSRAPWMQSVPIPALPKIGRWKALGYTPEELKLMWVAARTERELSLKTFAKHENKLNNDKQERKKVWDWLDKELHDLEEAHSLVSISNGEHCFYDPIPLIADAIVEYNISFNNYRIPMDLKRRTIAYAAYRKVLSPRQISNMLMKF